MMQVFKTAAAKILQMDIARFLVSGGFNTVVTYGLYLLLLNVVSYTTSYTIAYVAGIVLAYGLNRYFVFKSHQGIKSVALFPLVYLAQYLTSLLILWVWVEKLGWDSRIAPLIAIAITVPMTFVLSRYVFSTTKSDVGK